MLRIRIVMLGLVLAAAFPETKTENGPDLFTWKKTWGINMRTWMIFCMIVLVGGLGCTTDQGEKQQVEQKLHDWENLEILQRNRQPAHNFFVSFPDTETVLHKTTQESPFYLCLNGSWKFHLSETPQNRPEKFYLDDADVREWADIQVPGNWELQGFGVPIYTDTDYPFPPDPPSVPRKDNPVGSYRRSFEVPASWEGQRIYLCFDGVRSAFYVWINGQSVGYSQGSKTPAEFDVTDVVNWGSPNILAVEVYRFSDGSYLEDQDYWKISGIERDVFLHASPQIRIRDFYVQGALDSDFINGILQVEAELENHI